MWSSLICNLELFYNARCKETKIIELVRDMIPFIVLRGRWCNIIDLNVHEPSEEISDDSRTVFMRN